MRIGILTFHRAYNCGAMLQAWALKIVLERMGHEVAFPNCNSVGELRRWERPWVSGARRNVRGLIDIIRSFRYNLMSIPNEDVSRFRYARFRRNNIPEVEVSPNDFFSRFDLLIYGSDQIWHPDVSKPNADLFLGAGAENCQKISYAASYGDSPLADNVLEKVCAGLCSFHAISVREKIAKDQLSEYISREVVETLDPTLLIEAEEFENIARGSSPKEPYLFMYTLYARPFFVDTAKELAKRLCVKCVIAPCYQYSRWGAPKGLTYAISPDRLVQYARNAKYVLAGSFHGTVMGVMFRKPFLSLRGQVDQYESRPAALLRKIGCLNRLVNPTTSLDEMEHLLRDPLPDYSAALDKERTASLTWLKAEIGKV